MVCITVFLLGSVASHLDLEGETARTHAGLLEVKIGARTWHLHQGWQEIGLRGTGSKVWSGAKVLAHYLVRHPSLVKDKSVLELGCGVGLLSLTATDLGARAVFATDGEPSVLALARRNLLENLGGEMARVTVARLSWGGKLPAECAKGGRLDLILGSDIVYGASASAHTALVRTLTHLCGQHTRVLLAYRPRYRKETFFLEQVEKCFSVSIIPIDQESMQEALDAKVSILSLQKRPTHPHPDTGVAAKLIGSVVHNALAETQAANEESRGLKIEDQSNRTVEDDDSHGNTAQPHSSGASSPSSTPNSRPKPRPASRSELESSACEWRAQLRWEWSSDSLVDMGAAGVDDMVSPLGPMAPASDSDRRSDLE